MIDLWAVIFLCIGSFCAGALIFGLWIGVLFAQSFKGECHED